MKKLLKMVLPLVVLAAGGLGAWLLIELKPEVVPEPPEVVLPTVRAEGFTSRDHRVIVETQGSVVPSTESDLTSRVSGRVVGVSPNLVAGGFFERDEVLAQLESRDYELALAQAELSVARAERRLAEVAADAEVARREWEQLGEGEPSPLTLQEPQLAEARAALEAAKAERARALLDLERTEVRAPFAGRVREKHVDLGQFLMPGSMLARIYAVDYAEVRLPLADDSLAFLELPLNYRESRSEDHGPAVRLTTRFAGERREWPARIVRTEGIIDPQTRMVMAVARVDDPYGRKAPESDPGVPLAVGLFVDAAIQGILMEDVFVLPRTALRDDSQVYVLETEEGEARLTMLSAELLRSARDHVLVRGPELYDGMRVIVTPLEIATEGMRVNDLADDRAGTAGGSED